MPNKFLLFPRAEKIKFCYGFRFIWRFNIVMKASAIMSEGEMFISSLPEGNEKFWNIFDILNADTVSVLRNPQETVGANERAVIVRFRKRDEPGPIGLYAKIDILEIKTVLSLSQEAALFSEDYEALDRRELRSLGEIIACKQLVPIPFSELTT